MWRPKPFSCEGVPCVSSCMDTCIYMYIYMYIYVCIYIYIYICMDVHVCMCVCAYTHGIQNLLFWIDARKKICEMTHASLWHNPFVCVVWADISCVQTAGPSTPKPGVCIYTYMCIYIYIYMYIFDIYMYMYNPIYIYIYVYIYRYMYMHIWYIRRSCNALQTCIKDLYQVGLDP